MTKGFSSLTLCSAWLVVSVLATSSAEASVPRDPSRHTFSTKLSEDPFATAPQLDLPSLTQQLRAVEKHRAAAAECVALCELAAGIEAHPFGVPSAEPRNRSEDAWGNYRFTSELNASANRFGFTGHYWDKEASLYYAKARYYDPFTARFTQADSFLGSIDDPPSLHRYFYANENPTMYVDPTGFAAKITKALTIDGQGIAFGTDDTTVYANPTLDQLRSEVDAGSMTRGEAVFRQAEATLRPVADTPDWQKSSSRLRVEGGVRQLTLEGTYPMLQVMHGMLNNDATEIAEGGAGVVFMALAPKVINKTLGAAGGLLARVCPSCNRPLTIPRLGPSPGSQPSLAVARAVVNGRTSELGVLGDIPTMEQAQAIIAKAEATGGGTARLGLPTEDFVPKAGAPDYVRPRRAGPTRAQSRSVQGQPCTNCGVTTPKQVADHIEPLSVEHFRTGSIDVEAQRSIDAVQPHCPSCSAEQGGFLSAFARRMRDLLGIERK